MRYILKIQLQLNLQNVPHPGIGRMVNGGAGLQPGLYQCKSQAGIGLAAEELAGACSADEFSGVNNGAAAAEDGFGRALDLDAFEHGIVHAHVMRFRTDEFFVVGIEEHEVGVRAHGDSALARVEAKQFCGRGGDELDKAIRREVLAVDAAGVDQAEAVLDAWSAVRNFREVVLAEFLLDRKSTCLNSSHVAISYAVF